jgi:hypothetical protein
MKALLKTLAVGLFVLLSLAGQNISDADMRRFNEIKARHDRGEAVNEADRAFAQSVMARQNKQNAADRNISDTDMKRFNEIKARRDRGETVTADEQAFAQSVMARRNQQSAAERNSAYAKEHPPHEFTGVASLPDLGTGSYKGEQGGLYPGGTNVPPAAHLNAGLALARKIAPIDGKIVLLSIGMSNTTQEFQTFQKLAAADAGLNPKLVIVDGAQGGQTAAVTAQPQANFWKEVDRRLSAAGVTAAQVQAVWLKQANAGPTRPFPVEAKKLQEDIAATLHNLHDRFPNLKIAYLSSRIYAGYAATPLNPEPHAFETAFAVKWLIADQISGAPALNYDPAKGAVRSPWVAWGPYLWADGTKGRKDGLTYIKSDLGPDGTHPGTTGREKVARQLLQFLKTDPTSKSWFTKLKIAKAGAATVLAEN